MRKKGTSFKRKQTLFARSSTNFKKRWTILMRKIQSTRLKSSSSTSLIRKAMKLKTELMSVTNKCKTFTKRHSTSTTPKVRKLNVCGSRSTSSRKKQRTAKTRRMQKKRPRMLSTSQLTTSSESKSLSRETCDTTASRQPV